VKNAEQYSFIRQKEDILAIPSALTDSLQDLQANLYIKKAGVRVGTLIRNDLIPAHELALADLVSPVFPSADLDLSTALDYLRKKDIQLESGSKGWALVRYEKMILGWVKILPGRVNNYYPKELRILNM
jgi:NOL1/NOP2/fmu family ribosome biogenesis protein